jgi:uncharacterized protein (TIGR00251 family)
VSWCKKDGDDLLLFLRIQPRSSRDSFGEVVDGVRKLRIKAPPVDGKANAYLVKYLSKAFKIPKTRIKVESGLTGRNKRIRILDCEHCPDAISTSNQATR